MVKLAAGQNVPPILPRGQKGGTVAKMGCWTLDLFGHKFEEVSHPRWNTVLVGPFVGNMDLERRHLGRRASPTVENVENSGENVGAASRNSSADSLPTVSADCAHGTTAKADDDVVQPDSMPRTGGGDTTENMVGLDTPLVCPLASIGFMGYELVGSIKQHSVVAYVDSGSTANYISNAVAQQIALSPDGAPVQLQMADKTTRKTLGRLFGIEFKCGQLLSTFDADIFPGLAHDILLGLPWLVKENPHSDFRSGKIEVLQG